MECISAHNSENDVVFQENPKMAKESIGNSGRKMLADISNVPQKPSSLVQDNNKSRSNSANVKEYIDKLRTENATLIKLLADKNRIIDLSGAELHKLKITLQKMQMQNLQFAQSNSQMLAELSSCKDRLKDLQHQLGCKNGLLVAKRNELEGKRKIRTCETKDVKKVKVSEREEMGVCIVAEKDKEQCNTSARKNSKSLGPSVRKGQEKDVGDNGRIQARRQSARFKHEERKPKEDVFHADNVEEDIEDDSSSLSDDKIQEDDSSSVAFSVKIEDIEDDSLPNKVTQERKRSSISRPSRVAATKVQSYKEVGLQVKMRRPE